MIVTIASFKGGVGKTTTAFHLAEYFHALSPTLLVDGDANRSAVEWAKRGRVDFKVVDERLAAKFSRQFEHIIIDTPARPSAEDLKVLSQGCDLLVLPTAPSALAVDATVQMVDVLHSLQTRYKILLTLIPPPPQTAGHDARKAFSEEGLPLFKTGIRRLAVFEKAALEGVPVNQIKNAYARGAWESYASVGEEICG
ncbi:ParA family protein [Allocoleopsis sp.]|uniref:ParA family protein n=1 Tax=Allocoleopsis sp. TaxID=3088169 RepID=UPI002FD57CA9